MKNKLPEIALILTTIIWGATFLGTRTALATMGPFTFLAVRFAVGFLFLCLFVRRMPSKSEWRAGFYLALAIFIGFASQTVGLQTVTSAKSAFITSFYVPLVPIIQALLTREKPSRSATAGILLSFAGLLMISMQSNMSFSFGLGEFLTLISAFGAAAQIIIASRLAKHGDTFLITVCQLAFVMLVTGSIAGTEPMTLRPGPGLWIGVAMGVLATAGAMCTMNWAQKKVPPVRATVIYTLESVWAALFGWLAGEKLGPTVITGGALIMAGILVSEAVPLIRQRLATETA